MNIKLKTTKEELAKELGITTPYLRKLLRENDSRYIEKMADFYHLPVSAFIEIGEG
jgi:transcriptional regulator with XRE-family HTH domain